MNGFVFLSHHGGGKWASYNSINLPNVSRSRSNRGIYNGGDQEVGNTVNLVNQVLADANRDLCRIYNSHFVEGGVLYKRELLI